MELKLPVGRDYALSHGSWGEEMATSVGTHNPDKSADEADEGVPVDCAIDAVWASSYRFRHRPIASYIIMGRSPWGSRYRPSPILRHIFHGQG
jgi:hypothetical protein